MRNVVRKRPNGDATVAIFLAPHPHGFDELFVGVGDQWERQRLCGGKFAVAFGRSALTPTMS